MPQPKDEEKLVKNASPPFHIFSSNTTLIRHGYPFLHEITPDQFNSDVKLSKFIGCNVNDIAEIKSDLQIDVKKYRDFIDKTGLIKISENFPHLETTKASIKLKKSDIRISRNSCVLPLEMPTSPSDLNNPVLLSVVICKRKSIKKDQEFLVLSNQCLCDLRDAISCPIDNIYFEDHSENPGLENSVQVRDLSKSGYFFINNVFYNDMRQIDNIDQSKAIFDWMDQGNRSNTPPFCHYVTSRMELTKFDDLTIRIGYPYVYSHHGNCEHLIVFNDVRLINNQDSQHLMMYPRQIFKAKRNQKTCNICSIYPAKWICRNDMLSYTDPSYFCDRCFDYLHYDENHKKLTQFEAYPYKRK